MSRILKVTSGAALALLLAVSSTLSSTLAAAETHAHGDLTPVGKVTLGTIVAEIESDGAPTAGKEWHVTIDLPAGTAAPKAVRAWVGIKNGRGSEKAKAEPEAAHPNGFEAHVAVPSPLPAESALWISIENTAGELVTGSLALPAAADKPAPAKPTGHEGHQHGEHEGHKH